MAETMKLSNRNRVFFSAAQFSLLVLHHIKVRPISIQCLLYDCFTLSVFLMGYAVRRWMWVCVLCVCVSLSLSITLLLLYTCSYAHTSTLRLHNLLNWCFQRNRFLSLISDWNALAIIHVYLDIYWSHTRPSACAPMRLCTNLWATSILHLCLYIGHSVWEYPPVKLIHLKIDSVAST